MEKNRGLCTDLFTLDRYKPHKHAPLLTTPFLQELAEQIDTLNEDIVKKERRIREQEAAISYLQENVKMAEKRASSVAGRENTHWR